MKDRLSSRTWRASRIATRSRTWSRKVATSRRWCCHARCAGTWIIASWYPPTRRSSSTERARSCAGGELGGGWDRERRQLGADRLVEGHPRANVRELQRRLFVVEERRPRRRPGLRPTGDIESRRDARARAGPQPILDAVDEVRPGSVAFDVAHDAQERRVI